jgi:ech hydrogenase subunit F
MFKMTPNVLKNLSSHKATRRYPHEVRTPFENVRGELYNDIKNCTFCQVCAVKCPSQCITVDKKAATWTCDPFACVIAAYASTSVRASVFTKNMDTEFRFWAEK